METGMSDEMQLYAIVCLTKALKKYGINNYMAASYMVDEFDKKYNPAWNCMLGQKVHARVRISSNSYIILRFDQSTMFLFR